MVRVLVLGGSGMLGHMVQQVLSLSDSIAVAGTGRHDRSDPLYFEVEEGISKLEGIVEDQGPFTYLINCIGLLAQDIDERDSASICRAITVNALFPQELGRLCRRYGIRAVHISTDGVFPPDAGECFEDSPMASSDVYGRSKGLGEGLAPDMLVLRCSIIGPNPRGKKGLLEQLLSLPRGAQIEGYTDHEWNGVTTLQFADLCLVLIAENQFDKVRAEAPIHHFCPNASVSKYELMMMLKALFPIDAGIKAVSGRSTPVRRILDTKYHALKALCGYKQPMERALERLAAQA